MKVKLLSYLAALWLVLAFQASAVASQTEDKPSFEELQSIIAEQQSDIDSIREQLSEIVEASEEAGEEQAGGLEISGFFETSMQTQGSSEDVFGLGALELALEYGELENFAFSTALVWEEDAAEVAVAIIDYHVLNTDAPTRGQLFGEPGFHLQLGRFDVPFGIDYENFAAPDRPNITAPMTTIRIQK